MSAPTGNWMNAGLSCTEGASLMRKREGVVFNERVVKWLVMRLPVREVPHARGVHEDGGEVGHPQLTLGHP